MLPRQTLEIQDSTPAVRAAHSQYSLHSPPQPPASGSVGITEQSVVLFCPFEVCLTQFLQLQVGFSFVSCPSAIHAQGKQAASLLPVERGFSWSPV